MSLNPNKQYIGLVVPLPQGAYSFLYTAPYLKHVRSACEAQIRAAENHAQSQGWKIYTSSRNVTECILQSLPETTKAILSGRSVILTLWPSFIGAIAATAPDPASIVYDNIWWAALFAATCSGFPGLSRTPISHQLEATSYEKAKSICEGRHVVPKYFETGQWIAFIWSCALFFAWNILFAITLTQTVCYALTMDISASPGAWYWVSAGPAISQALRNLAQNNVEIYLPLRTSTIGIHESHLLQGEDSAENKEPKNFLASRFAASTAVAIAPALAPLEPSNTPNDPTTISYQRLETRSSLHTWLCILRHQWHCRPYRLLVKEAPESWGWFNAFFGLWMAFGRLTIFAFGSVLMGNLILMPLPNDLVLFVLLIFMTATPRFLWPTFWTKGKRGADLVVFVKSLDWDEFSGVE